MLVLKMLLSSWQNALQNCYLLLKKNWDHFIIKISKIIFEISNQQLWNYLHPTCTVLFKNKFSFHKYSLWFVLCNNFAHNSKIGPLYCLPPTSQFPKDFPLRKSGDKTKFRKIFWAIVLLRLKEGICKFSKKYSFLRSMWFFKVKTLSRMRHTCVAKFTDFLDLDS